jgi:tetratricopeptide (TPR) repeat protein
MRHISLPLLFVLSSMFSLTALGQADRDNGIHLYAQGKYVESAAVLKTVIDSDKKDRLAWMFLGASLLRADEKKEALAAFKKGNLNMKDSVDFYEKQLEIKYKPRATYTHLARQNLTTGAVKIAVEFLANGSIGFVYPVEQLPDGLTQNCIQAAHAIKFKPAEKNGIAVTTIRMVEYTFEITTTVLR